MDPAGSIAVHTGSTRLAATPDAFLGKIRDILSQDGHLLNWNSDGKGFSFNRLQLEEHLKSAESQFAESSVEAFIIQLKQRDFEATAAELVNENVDDEDTFLAFKNANFYREDQVLVDLSLAQPRPKRAIYCSAEKHYLRNKRAHDPCYKLMGRTQRLPVDLAKDRFRAVVAQQKLKRIIRARLQAQAGQDVDVFRDLLPNEANISIQMGAIAGYYGETVVEEDLIRFFGKFLPMYKPISDVVDSITPSISNKIQASSFVWGNQSADCDQQRQPTAIVTSSGLSSGNNRPVPLPKTPQPTPTAPNDLYNDITFEYVSFKDQLQPVLEKNKIRIAEAKTTGSSDVGASVEQPILVPHQQRDDFITINGGDCDENDPLNGGGAVGDHSQTFPHNLLDSNYYDTSSHDFGMELKNAIDLIM